MTVKYNFIDFSFAVLYKLYKPDYFMNFKSHIIQLGFHLAEENTKLFKLEESINFQLSLNLNIALKPTHM